MNKMKAIKKYTILTGLAIAILGLGTFWAVDSLCDLDMTTATCVRK